MRQLAVSLPPGDACSLSLSMRQLAGRVGAVEVRLDLCPDLDLSTLEVPPGLPWIATCRPQREGGAFVGDESARAAALRRAVMVGASHLDVEWDAVASLGLENVAAQTIVSRHWFEQMPSDLEPTYRELRAHGDVVKLVGMADAPEQVLPVLELLERATSPLVAMAMGPWGPLTRLVAPCFPACAFVYASFGRPTAPGQLATTQMERIWRGRSPRGIARIELVHADAGRRGDGEPDVLRVPLPGEAEIDEAALREVLVRMPRPARLVG